MKKDVIAKNLTARKNIVNVLTVGLNAHKVVNAMDAKTVIIPKNRRF